MVTFHWNFVTSWDFYDAFYFGGLTVIVQCCESCSISYYFFPNLVLLLLQVIQRFAIVDLSNFYFDVAKDRLYVGYVH